MSSLDDIFAKKPSAKRSAPSDGTTSRAAKKRALAKPAKKAAPKPVAKAPEIDQETLDAQEVFKRYFEQQFKPIEKVVAKLDKKSAKKSKKTVAPEPESEAEDEEENEEGDSEGEELGMEDLEGLGDFDGLSADSGSSDEEMGGLDEEEQADDDSDEDDGMMLLPGLIKPQPSKPVVEVVEHTATLDRPAMTRAELKAFMSSKPPTDPSSVIGPDVIKELGDVDEPGEKDNLKNDLALQRLLAESHLIQSGQDSLSHTGKAHHKATDLRLQALGAKTSVFTQAKMPLSHRKGMMKKSAEKEETRRKEARENGIILERIKGGSKGGKERRPMDRRERGVGAPAVGRFEGGTLKISKRDVYEIEGPKKREGKSGRGGRGGGRGGRGGKRGGRGK